VAELGDLLFRASTIWMTQMSTVMGTWELESHFFPAMEKMTSNLYYTSES
jgi:hypothetical protein